jgi:uracil-DNA glycosylase family 4
MNKKIARLVRDPKCTDCRLYSEAEDVCVTASGPKRADIMVVGRMPNSPQYQRVLEADLEEAGFDPTAMVFTSAIKCRNFTVNATRTSVKACHPYLAAEIAIVKPKWILTLGNEALQSMTNNSGIMKHRGRVIDRGEYSVFPTISPSSVSRNPGQRAGYIADLKLFFAEVMGKEATIVVPPIHYVKTKADLEKLRTAIEQSEGVSYDVETRSHPMGSEWAPDAVIVSLSVTLWKGDDLTVWALPLSHPESPFRNSWQKVLRYLKPALEGVRKKIAQNGKYDARWLKQFGVEMTVTFDTMLASHLINENVSKGLKQQAAMRLGVRPWAIDTKDLWTTPIMEVLEYNALDTFYTYHLYLEMKRELGEQPRLARVFKFVMTPANNILIDVERRGVWIDRQKLSTNTKIAFDMRAEIDRQIMEFVPSEDEAEEAGWPTQGKRAKLAEVNFNPSNFLRWLLFDHLELPVIARGKEKDDGSPGDPSVAEAVMLELKGKHPIVQLLLDRSKWQKYCSSFLTSYGDLLDENDRIHTTFKLYGTVTGRLSSGKAEADKVTARAPVRGVNLQQVPRDPFIRGLFGAAPGYTFVEADFSQVELRVVAFLSRDRTMMHLYQTGQDIHKATAASVLGVPISQVSKDDRKKAKAVNFGFVYGMGAQKFVYTAFEKYELIFSLTEAEEVRRAFFEMFKGLIPWHARQRRLVNEYRRVVSPLGRVRHLPDIDSGQVGVRREAERQAINSPVQSFASDMTMLSMVLIQEKFERLGIKGRFICTVHDSLMFEVKDSHVGKALPIIKGTMENLPLDKKFGVSLDVPIVSDLQVGRYWGESRELTEEEVYDWSGNVD